jgi:hypothetical protein
VFDDLRGNRMQVVLMGDPQVIQSQVAPLGLGPREELRVGVAAGAGG